MSVLDMCKTGGKVGDLRYKLQSILKDNQ